jgi:hypothetical protein
MFHFNNKGFLVPVSNISFSVNEFYLTFVEEFESERREILFRNFLDYTKEIMNVLDVDSEKQWINGSFTTKIDNPKDIDLVTFIDEAIFLKYSDQLWHFTRHSNWKKLGIDAYFVILRPTGSLLFSHSESDKLYWYHHFTKVKPTKRLKQPIRKGFVEIIH